MTQNGTIECRCYRVIKGQYGLSNKIISKQTVGEASILGSFLEKFIGNRSITTEATEAHFFFSRNRVRRAGFEFVSTGIDELKSCVSNSIPVKTNLNPVIPAQKSESPWLP